MKRKITLLSPFFPKRLRKYVKKIIQKKEIKAYKGNNVFCPMCQSQFRVFATYGVEKRENARCLNCNSLERHRLLWKYLNEKTTLNDGSKVKMLHFAPQRSYLKAFSENKNIEYTPADLNPETYEYFDIIKINKANVMEIPFEDNSYDVVICNHVLEHVDNDKVAMAELFRVMKSGGWGIFQVPIDYGFEISYEDPSITDRNVSEKACGKYDHLRLYGRDYKNRLESVGFIVNEDDYVNSFSDKDIKKFGFSKKERIYYCQKQ